MSGTGSAKPFPAPEPGVAVEQTSNIARGMPGHPAESRHISLRFRIVRSSGAGMRKHPYSLRRRVRRSPDLRCPDRRARGTPGPMGPACNRTSRS